MDGSSTLELKGKLGYNVFDSNTSTKGGGAIRVAGTSKLTMEHYKFYNTNVDGIKCSRMDDGEE